MTDLSGYLRSTRLLNYESIELMKTRQHLLTHIHKPKEQLKKLYDYVSSLPLGYSTNDDIPASQVLKDGYGQCNTKVTLLMALARGAGIPCRVHCYRLSIEVQKGRAPEWVLAFAPKTTLFTWPEFYLNHHWQPLHKIVHTETRDWNSCPFDGAKYALEPVKPEWIIEDQGVWDSQDEYFKKHQPSITGWRKLGWKFFGRRAMNKNLC
jgi:hypothetical protein